MNKRDMFDLKLVYDWFKMSSIETELKQKKKKTLNLNQLNLLSIKCLPNAEKVTFEFHFGSVKYKKKNSIQNEVLFTCSICNCFICSSSGKKWNNLIENYLVFRPKRGIYLQ